MASPASVVFYVSGHGFGHAIRQIEIIKALASTAPHDLRIVVRTSAAPWLFQRAAPDSLALLPGEVDTGVVQFDSLTLDETATIDAAAAFFEAFDGRLEAERQFLEAQRASLVVSDAPPLACAAAHAAGIPSVVCANFTWDWIYDEYRDASPAAPFVIARIRELYSLAAEGWRLPLHGGFETVSAVVDVPLVARHPAREAAEVRAALGLPGSKLAFATFGGYGLRELPLQDLDCLHDWQIVLTTRESGPGELPHGIIRIPEKVIYERGLHYEDLVRTVDVVISKPGYGIISDCVANGAALLYTSRGRFPEYDVMVREMPRWVRCQFISQEDFFAGRWQTALHALERRTAPPVSPPTNGAEVVAQMILRMIREV